ncbi:MAG: GatB/YqeY domain-containing protein [bacterium]|nr:GatB/YqeY domain-containing protein [bacterium]
MLLEKINSDIVEAMKAKDSLRTETLRMVKSALNYVKIEKKKEILDDEDVLAIISKQVKQHKESVESFEKGGRAELADKEKKELVILESYMPKQISHEEVNKIIKETVREVGAAGKKDFGKVMKAVSAKLKNQADGKVVSRIVGEELSKIENA